MQKDYNKYTVTTKRPTTTEKCKKTTRWLQRDAHTHTHAHTLKCSHHVYNLLCSLLHSRKYTFLCKLFELFKLFKLFKLCKLCYLAADMFLSSSSRHLPSWFRLYSQIFAWLETNRVVWFRFPFLYVIIIIIIIFIRLNRTRAPRPPARPQSAEFCFSSRNNEASVTGQTLARCYLLMLPFLSEMYRYRTFH